MLWIIFPAKASTICTVLLPRPEKITRLRLRSSVKWSRRPCTPGSGISCTWRMGGASRSWACAAVAMAPRARAHRKAGFFMVMELVGVGSKRLSGNDFEDAQLRAALLVPWHGDEDPAPLRNEEGRARDRTGGDACDALVAVGIELLDHVEESFAAGHVDTPRCGVERQAIEDGDGGDARDNAAGIRVEHHDAGRSAHAEEEPVVRLVEVERHVLLDAGNDPFGDLLARLPVEDDDLALFRDEHEHASAAAFGDTASRMRIGGERGDLPASGRIEHGEVAELLARIAPAGAYVDLLRLGVVADRIRAEGHHGDPRNLERRAVERLQGAVPAARHEELVHFRDEQHALRLGEAGQRTRDFSGSHVDHLDGVLLERREEYAPPLHVGREVVDSPAHIGERDDLHGTQWRLVLSECRARHKGAGQAHPQRSRRIHRRVYTLRNPSESFQIPRYLPVRYFAPALRHLRMNSTCFAWSWYVRRPAPTTMGLMLFPSTFAMPAAVAVPCTSSRSEKSCDSFAMISCPSLDRRKSIQSFAACGCSARLDMNTMRDMTSV